MTIYILDEDAELCARYLDDHSLNSMIEDIARVLCNVHHVLEKSKLKNIPLKYLPAKHTMLWVRWTRECKANYLWMVELGLSIYYEWFYRYKEKPKDHNSWIENKGYVVNKSYEAISWARDNVPNLPEIILPLVIPKKYIETDFIAYDRNGSDQDEEPNVIKSYCNYYQAKIKRR